MFFFYFFPKDVFCYYFLNNSTSAYVLLDNIPLVNSLFMDVVPSCQYFYSALKKTGNYEKPRQFIFCLKSYLYFYVRDYIGQRAYNQNVGSEQVLSNL